MCREIRAYSRRLAQRDHRSRLAAGGMAKTDGGSRIKETIDQHADMKGACRVRQHDTQAATISDHAGKRLQLGRRAVERLGDPYRSWAGMFISDLRLAAARVVRRRRCRLYLRAWRYDPDI